MFFLLFIWPVIFVVCLAVARFRPYLLYIATHALAFLACLGGICLAPSRFLNWWWD